MIEIDSHEPESAPLIIGQSVPCEVVSLNAAQWADYYWQTVDGKDVHVERKTWNELLSGVDKVEDQIRRHLQDKPEARLIFMLEGIVVPTMMGTTILKPANKNSIWVTAQNSSVRLSQTYAWLYQIQQYCEVFMVPDFPALCTALVACYKSDQKEHHDTLQRHFKAATFTPDFRVIQLIGIMPGMGESRAKALVAEFGTLWNILNSTPEQLQVVPGIGPKLSVELLRMVGRPDV